MTESAEKTSSDPLISIASLPANLTALIQQLVQQEINRTLATFEAIRNATSNFSLPKPMRVFKLPFPFTASSSRFSYPSYSPYFAPYVRTGSYSPYQYPVGAWVRYLFIDALQVPLQLG